MRYLGIDPGSKKCGWAIVDLASSKVLDSGHADLNEMRKIIETNMCHLDGVVIEMLVRYKMSNSIDLLGTAYTIGRLQEMFYISRSLELTSSGIDRNIELLEFTRPEVIFRLTGRWPGRTNKVSKAGLQVIVQNLLKLEKPIRPQHANDAAALVVATTHPVKAIINVKPSRRVKQPTQAQSGRRPKHT
jgi:Holliday junction resolvasome RuvABC endonuclease subunit